MVMPIQDDGFAYLSQDLLEARRKDEIGNDAARVRMYRAYAEGRHEETLTIDQQRLISRKPDHTIADNVCRLILSTAASRLELQRFTVASDEQEDAVDTSAAADDLRAFLTRLWIVNRLGRLQYETHFAFLRDGNSALSLSWRQTGKQSGDVRVNRETWWDGESGVFMAYDHDGTPEWAVKEFDAPDPTNPKVSLRRRTVYYPDRIARYVQRGNGWAEYATDNQPAVVAWARADGRPLGIPIIHFPNGSAVSDSPYGISDLTGLIGLQDDLNSVQADMAAAAMFSGFQVVTGTGIDDGKLFKVAPGAFLWTPKDSAKFGVLPPGDMSQLASTHSYKRQTMATDSSTPLHAITGGDWPSGEALTKADMPLQDKVERLASVAGPQWTQLAHQATEIANVFGAANLNEDIPITAIFAPAERVDESTELDLQLKRVSVWQGIAQLPKTAMLKTGLVTKEEADAIIAENTQRDVSLFGVTSQTVGGEL